MGCGYVGLPLAAELAGQGHKVFGLCRTRRVEAELKSHGVALLQADVTKPQTLSALPREYDWVVNCVSSSGGGEQDYREVYLGGTQNLIEFLRTTPPRKFIYTSSTSVYGQTDGSEVTEASVTEPASTTGKILIETEKTLVAAAVHENFPAVVLRAAGIYGPDRGHWFKQFLKGEAVMEGVGDRMLNMIHREDVVGGIVAALNHGKPGEIYNVADDEPVSQANYFHWLSKALGRPMPPSAPENRTAFRKRGVTNKKVSNARLKGELNYNFKYATYREGYQAEIQRLGLLTQNK